MKILFFALFLLVMGLILMGIPLLLRKLAYEKNQRYLHGRLVIAVFAAALLFANVYTISPALLLVDAVVNSDLLAPVFDVVLPNRAYELVYMLLTLFGLNLLMELVVLLTVLIVKFVFRKKNTFINIDDYYGWEKLRHLPWILAGRFYDEDNGQGLLNTRGICSHIWAKNMKNAFVFVWAAEILLISGSILWGSDGWNQWVQGLSKAWYLLPMAAFLVTEQIELMLDPNRGDDEVGSFASADIRERLSGDITRLMEVYRRIFAKSGALLYSEAGERRAQSQEGMRSNDLGNRQIHDCAQPQVLSFMSSQLRESGIRQCGNYQNALVELLNGKSVNVRDQGDGEFLVYLAAYLNYYLSQGKTAMVLCRDEAQVKAFSTQLRERLRQLNSLYNIWSICSVREADMAGRVNVLVCSYDELLAYNVLEKHPQFAANLFCTTVLEASRLFSRDLIHIRQIFNRIQSINRSQQYIVMTDEDDESLRTAVESVIKKELLPFNNDSRMPNTCVMVWKEESYYKLQSVIGVGNALSPYMGTALPLALVAAKYDMPQVYIIPDGARGDLTYQNAMAMSRREIMKYIGRGINLASVIRYDPFEAMEQQEISVVIVYDNDYNFYNALWRWMKYGGSGGTLLHIISKPYLLRDYFAANVQEKQLLLKNNEFDALIPYSLGLKVSHTSELLVSICDTGLTEKDLLEKSREYGWKYDNVEPLLADCLSVVLRREEIHSIYEYFHFEEEKLFSESSNSFARRTRITMTDDNVRRRLMEKVGYAQLNSKGNQVSRLDILSGNLTNYYLRGQVAAFGGNYYRISRIKDGCVYAEQEMPQTVPQYYPVSEFTFENYTRVDACVDTNSVDINLCCAKVGRRIYGYWSSLNGNEFAGGDSIQIYRLPEDADGRPYSWVENAAILELSFRRADLGERSDQAVQLCAFMLAELFKTLFPDTWQNLYAAAGRADRELIGRVFKDGADCSLDDKILSIIPHVASAPADSEFATLYIVEFSCIEYGMVQMLYNKRESIFRIMREYLSWALNDGEPDGESKSNYLCFGADRIPEVFAPQELLRLMEKMAPSGKEHEAPAPEETHEAETRCTFCGRPSLFTVELEDGRCMCGNCKDHQLSRKEEIKSLFVETVQILEKSYSITLRDNIHVRFQSAEAIRKATGGTENGRVLGFYRHRSHQLWLESRGPRISMQSTLFHELTHAWQFDNLDLKRLERRLALQGRRDLFLKLIEGHAMYVEIKTMRRLNETDYADWLHSSTWTRDDEYGAGYRMLCQYLQEKEEEGSHMNAFTAMERLVAEIIEGKEVLYEDAK